MCVVREVLRVGLPAFTASSRLRVQRQVPLCPLVRMNTALVDAQGHGGVVDEG